MTGIVRQHSVVGLGIPPQEAIQIARRVLAAEGYQSVAVGATAATFVRDVRPAGVTIAAYACAVPTLGLSLFALLIRTQEQCTVTGESSRHGTALSLSGVVTTQTLQDLEAALRHGGGHPPVATPGRGEPAQRPVTPVTPARAGPAPYPEPVPLLGQTPLPPPPPRPQTPDRVAQPESLPTPLLPPLPPPPLPSPPDANPLKRPRQAAPVPNPELDLTVVRPSPLTAEPIRRFQPPPPAPRWVLVLDDGRTIDVPDFALIGRDPEPAEDDPEAGLVSMIDPEMSVSKTHASFGVDDEGLWFVDRFSTNGTSMQAPGAERIGLEPGIATPIPPGSDIWIGRRHLQIDRVDSV